MFNFVWCPLTHTSDSKMYLSDLFIQIHLQIELLNWILLIYNILNPKAVYGLLWPSWFIGTWQLIFEPWQLSCPLYLLVYTLVDCVILLACIHTCTFYPWPYSVSYLSSTVTFSDLLQRLTEFENLGIYSPPPWIIKFLSLFLVTR